MSNENANAQTPNPGTKDDLKQKLAAAAAANAELAAQVAALQAQLEAKNAEQTAPKAAADAAAMHPKMDKIFIPRAAHGGEDPNLVVGFNGRLSILPKGKESVVPFEVAEEIRRGWRAEANFDKTRERKLEEAAQAEAQLNQLKQVN